MTTVMEMQDLTLEYPIPRKYRKEKFSPSATPLSTTAIKFTGKTADKLFPHKTNRSSNKSIKLSSLT